MNEQNQPEILIRCEQIETLAVLSACGELNAAEQAALEAHAERCPACAGVMAREARMQKAIAGLDQPADSLDRSSLLLAQCRSELSEALDDEQARAVRPGWRAAVSPASWWMVFRRSLLEHPALTMAALVIVSFLAGVLGQRWPSAALAPARPVVTVSATPRLTDQELQNAAGANVSWVTRAGSPAPAVQVQLMSQAPLSIVGSPDDAEVRRALTFVLSNAQRFDPGARLDSLDVLRTRLQDADVRKTLCDAACADENPGVRIRALEALQGLEQDPVVQQTLITALEKDGNSGVRIVAINLLMNALRGAGPSGPAAARILNVLRDRLQNDRSNYIRLESAAALRELEPGGLR
jgi:anti-sigma factor RsiW